MEETPEKQPTLMEKSPENNPKNEQSSNFPENQQSSEEKRPENTPQPTGIEEPEEATPSTSADSIKGKKPKPITLKTKTKSLTSISAYSKPPKPSVLQLRITLAYIDPPIWRRIQVLNNITFEELRYNINEAMGWMSSRSHQFIARNPENLEENIMIVDGKMEFYDFKEDRLLKEQSTKISKFLCAENDVIFYEFDMAECWLHQVVLEKVLPPSSPKESYPKIKGGERACPPEDCGGVDGYNHLVEVYKNPEHEEYNELIEEWLEDMYPGYDPEKFDHKDIFKKVWVLMMG